MPGLDGRPPVELRERAPRAQAVAAEAPAPAPAPAVLRAVLVLRRSARIFPWVPHAASQPTAPAASTTARVAKAIRATRPTSDELAFRTGTQRSKTMAKLSFKYWTIAISAVGLTAFAAC